MRSGRLLSVVVGACLVGAALSACSASSSAGTSATARISVVASTDVYGDIVSQIAGEAVDTTSIISDPNQDPHSYQANTKTQLELSKATIVVENGGGYDDFVDTMLSTGAQPRDSRQRGRPVRQAAPRRARTSTSTSGTTSRPSSPLAHTLIADSHRGRPGRRARRSPPTARSFITRVERAGGARGRDQGGGRRRRRRDHRTGSAVPARAHAGLVDKTPPAFSEAVEEGSDVSPRVLAQTLQLFSTHAVKLLVYNEQTSGTETEEVLAAAKAAGIAVVPVTETLPAGKDYLTWMAGNLDAVQEALGTP